VSRRQTTPNKRATTPATRCAIYTRKSSDEGLQQEFNSLDAQREAAEAYIASQKAEGWVCLPDRYDDGGFTGGNMERPALRRLLADIDAGKIDCVVVYKVDRLSRSLMDFARIVDVFERHNVSFVSVTQHFNTTQSMGRLTLNILLSFAQFEREIIGERIRDKIAASRQKGKWTGGTPILGYDVDRSNGGPKLVIIRGIVPERCHDFDDLLHAHRIDVDNRTQWNDDVAAHHAAAVPVIAPKLDARRAELQRLSRTSLPRRALQYLLGCSVCRPSGRRS